jgi:hypothetical protein
VKQPYWFEGWLEGKVDNEGVLDVTKEGSSLGRTESVADGTSEGSSLGRTEGVADAALTVVHFSISQTQ